MSKVVWLARAFLDYRAPVVEALLDRYGDDLHIIVSTKWMPEHILKRLKASMGENLVCLEDEITLGEKNLGASMANSKIRLPLQPGIMGAIRKLDPDVILGDGFFQWSFYGYLYKLVYGCSLVVCYERTMHTERKSQWYRNAYRKIMVNYTSSFCVNGKESVEYLRTLGVPERVITTGYMVHEPKKVVKPDEKIFSSDKVGRVFLFVGQLIERKGVDILVSSWANTMSSSRDVLILVGVGELSRGIEALIEEKKIKNIQLAGHVEHIAIHGYYQRCDVCVMPTLEDNWSLVVPEAMSFSKPVITTIYNGCHRELINEDTGLVVDPLVISELDNALLKFSLMSNGDLAEMGVSAKKLIEKRTPETAAKAIFDAIQIAVHSV